MLNQENVYLALRLFSLYIIVIYLPGTIQFVQFLFTNNDVQGGLIFLLSAIPPFIGVYLWLYARKLTRHFIIERTIAPSEGKVPELNIFKLACILLGLYLMVINLPYIVSNIYFYSAQTGALEAQNMDPSLYSSFPEGLVAQIISAVVGFTLIVGNGFYAYWLERARTFGLKK